jgi:hypothetical protein
MALLLVPLPGAGRRHPGAGWTALELGQLGSRGGAEQVVVAGV